MSHANAGAQYLLVVTGLVWFVSHLYQSNKAFGTCDLRTVTYLFLASTVEMENGKWKMENGGIFASRDLLALG